MFALSSKGGHSAKVKMRLLVSGQSIPVAQMGSDFLLVDAPFDHPPANAVILLRVDDSEQQWNVRLPDGISTASSRISIVPSQPNS